MQVRHEKRAFLVPIERARGQRPHSVAGDDKMRAERRCRLRHEFMFGAQHVPPVPRPRGLRLSPATRFRSLRRGRFSRPISSITGTASGETWFETNDADSALDSREHIAEPVDIEQARRGVGEAPLAAACARARAGEARHRRGRRTRHLPAGLLLARGGGARSAPR